MNDGHDDIARAAHSEVDRSHAPPRASSAGAAAAAATAAATATARRDRARERAGERVAPPRPRAHTPLRKAKGTSRTCATCATCASRRSGASPR